jgi:D-alanine-D-alanine ligase
MKVLILHTLPPERCNDGRWEWEFDLHATANEIHAVLPQSTIVGVRGEPGEMMDVLAREQPAAVFNLCEAPLCNPRLEPHAAAIFEWLGIPFTGAGSETLAMCRRKDIAKQVLRAAGVTVPSSGGFPCIVKPLDEDGSAGIHADSVCHSEEAVSRALARLGGPALVEAFVPGREFVVSLWGRDAAEHAVVGEIAFDNGVQIISYVGKWDMESHDYVNAPLVFHQPLDEAIERPVVETAKAAWRALGLRGYGTVDIRLDEAGNPCVLDVNPNAALNEEGRVQRAVCAYGWTWERFVRQQVEWAR